MDWGRAFAALRRHITLWNAGEKTDPDTGKPHLWLALAELTFLVTYEMRGHGTDTRSPYADTALLATLINEPVFVPTDYGVAKSVGENSLGPVSGTRANMVIVDDVEAMAFEAPAAAADVLYVAPNGDVTPELPEVPVKAATIPPVSPLK